MSSILSQLRGRKGQRVILVAEHPRIRSLAQIALERAGFHVEVIDTFEEVRKQARKFPPDLVVFEGSSFAAMELRMWLSNDPATAHVEVLHVSSQSEKTEEPQGPTPFATD